MKNGIVLVVTGSMTVQKEEKYKQRVKPLIHEVDPEKKVHFNFGNPEKCHETVHKVYFDLDNDRNEKEIIRHVQKCLSKNNKNIVPVYLRITTSPVEIENCINISCIEDAVNQNLQPKIKEEEAA